MSRSLLMILLCIINDVPIPVLYERQKKGVKWWLMDDCDLWISLWISWKQEFCKVVLTGVEL